MPSQTPGSTTPEAAADLRKTFIRHEALITSIGTHLLMNFIVGVLGFYFLASLTAGSEFTIGEFKLPAPGTGGLLLFGLFVMSVGVAGLSLRQLNVRGIIPATLVFAIGLLQFPLGTLLNGYMLLNLHNKAGRFIFTREYAQARLATPSQKLPVPVFMTVINLMMVLVIGGLGVALLAR